MQRLFSMFPQGGPGFALFLLRISVAATFVMNGANLGAPSSDLLFTGVCLISASLTIGFLTPLSSLIVCLFSVVNLLIGPRSGILVWGSFALNSAALALLGPGAYSLDARLFGRRVIVVPPRRDSDSL